MPLISPFLVWIFCIYWKFKTNRYLHRMCPQQKMSSIGKFRRNFTTFEQTTQFISINFFYGFVHQGLLFGLLQAFSFKPETNFLLANICDYLYMDIYHGIVLPMIMEIPPTLSLNRRRCAPDFYVRKPQFFEPRRPVQSKEQNSTSGSSAALCWTEESKQTNKRRRTKIYKVSRDRSSSTDLHRERKRSSSGDKRLDTIFTTKNQTKTSGAIQMPPHSAAGEKKKSKSLEDLLRGKRSVGELNSPSSRILTRRLQNRSEKHVTGIREGNTAERKSQTIKVQVHGRVSQGSNQTKNSHFRSSRSDPIVPIDI